MKKRVSEYKKSMISIFEIKYGWSQIEAEKVIRDYDFDKVLKLCNYVALHDDPEIWVDTIYRWANTESELLEM